MPHRVYEIRQRAFTFDAQAVAADYREEFAYISRRRESMANGTARASAAGPHAADAAPEHLSGLAFSGGGIRSATFHLGILEALQQMDKLKRIDYLSTVSGGSYIAGWLLGHAGEEREDDFADLIQTQDLDTLLDPKGDFVTHLRHHSGFLRENGFWEGPALIGSYLWRIPFYYVWDVGLHIKTYPGVGNLLHLYSPYRRRIELTYLRGQEDSSLAGMYEKSQAPPYLIVNGNLVNRGRPRGYPTEVNRPYRDNYNFEFTKDFVGSDGLGYVQTEGFGLPVVTVLDRTGQPAEIDPRWVVVEDPTQGTCRLDLEQRIRKEYCARLSDAMTASGAGLDSDSLLEETYHDDLARLLMRFVSVPFNINGEFQSWNYARRYNTTLGTVWDYVLMMTVQRLWPDTKSRWIEVTDGSFFDNLGVYSLLRRQVSHVIVGDATLDQTWQYDYLHNLQAKIRKYFGNGVEWCGEIPKEHEVVWYRRFWVRRPDGRMTVIHYVKPYVYNAGLFRKNPELTSSEKAPFLSARPQPVWSIQPGQSPSEALPTHLDLERLKHLIPGGGLETELAKSLQKVTQFAKSEKANGFPQTGTLFQWFDLEEFEAYRHLGYVMGWAYLATIDFSARELLPAEACRPIPMD